MKVIANVSLFPCQQELVIANTHLKNALECTDIWRQLQKLAAVQDGLAKVTADINQLYMSLGQLTH